MTDRATLAQRQAVLSGLRRHQHLRARVVANTGQATLRDFVQIHVMLASEIFTDEHKGYSSFGRQRYSVSHSAGENVRGRIHTNSIDSIWALFKRGFRGTYYKMSKKHLQR